MTYIPKLALQLQSFSSVEEMNHHLNLHYFLIKNQITKSQNEILHLIKKYACVVAGVCWLKQDTLAHFANVSVKTVERGLKFFKEMGVLKIYHTKRSNGLNGNCYYVLQPFTGSIYVDDEEIVSVEEKDVGADESLQTFEVSAFEGNEESDKLLRSSRETLVNSTKALKNSYETKIEEMNDNARVGSNLAINKQTVQMAMTTREDFRFIVQFLVNQQFSEVAAREVTKRVLLACTDADPSKVLKSFAKAVQKFHIRLCHQQPIFSVVDYFEKLVMAELQPEFVREKVNGPQATYMGQYEARRREVMELWDYSCKHLLPNKKG